MDDFKLKTPVALLIFNRAETTQKVFEAIRHAKPPVLLVIADGPRADRAGEADRCAAARAVVERVDWQCEVLKNYSDFNLGIKRRASSGLNWVFQQVAEAIILEDDCLPHPTFFRFAQELLTQYRDDEQIAQISGSNFQFGRQRTSFSYYFSHFTHTWGWATWRRAWKDYDAEMKLWRTLRESDWLKQIVKGDHAVVYWKRIFQSMYDGEIDTWDYPWLFANWVKERLSVTPNVNLVTNIGFQVDATHTTGDSPYANIPLRAIRFPLRHTPEVVRHQSADRFTQNSHFTPMIRFRVERELHRMLVRNVH